jgi:hypothetical protein
MPLSHLPLLEQQPPHVAAVHVPDDDFGQAATSSSTAEAASRRTRDIARD